MKHFTKVAVLYLRTYLLLICWNSKNGVALKREELEGQSSSKYVVMNGGKQEVGAAVNMVFRKESSGEASSNQFRVTIHIQEHFVMNTLEFCFV